MLSVFTTVPTPVIAVLMPKDIIFLIIFFNKKHLNNRELSREIIRFKKVFYCRTWDFVPIIFL